MYEPNELVPTIIDQAHTIRVLHERIAEIERLVADCKKALEPPPIDDEASAPR